MQKWFTIALFVLFSAASHADDCHADGKAFHSLLGRVLEQSTTPDKDLLSLRLEVEAFPSFPARLAAVQNCLFDDTFLERFEIYSRLATISAQMASEDAKLEWYLSLGFRKILIGLGLIPDPRAVGGDQPIATVDVHRTVGGNEEHLLGLDLIPASPTAIPLEGARKALAELIEKNEITLAAIAEKRATITAIRDAYNEALWKFGKRCMRYQLMLTSLVLANLLQHAPHLIPHQLFTLTGAIPTAGSLIASSIALAHYLWPHLRLMAEKYDLKKEFEALVAEMADALEKYSKFTARVIEKEASNGLTLANEYDVTRRAAVPSLISVRNVETNRALANLGTTALDVGAFETGGQILHELVSRYSSPDMIQMERDITRSVDLKKAFEKKIRDDRWLFLRNRLVLVGIAVGVAGAAIHYLAPEHAGIIKTLVVQVLSLSVARAYFVRAFAPPDDAKKFKEDRQEMKDHYSRVLDHAPAEKMRFITGIAKIDPKTHPYIQQAALEAIKESDNPVTAAAMSELAEHAAKLPGKRPLVAEYLQEAIRKRADCARKLLTIYQDSFPTAGNSP